VTRRDVEPAPAPTRGAEAVPVDDPAIGCVVAHYGVEVVVRTSDGTCRRMPISRRSSLVVGDRVRLDGAAPEPLPARGVLRRRDRRGRVRTVAANLDAVGIVLAPVPETPDAFVDRAVVGARAAGTDPFVVVNKADLDGADALVSRVRADWPGVDPVLLVSAERGSGLDALRAHLARGLRAVFVGVSGVGKSSLANALVADASLAVGEINPASGLGRHVTTNATLHALPGGGELIDTPGFRDFGPVAVSGAELAAHFPGFEGALASGCRYRDCRHRSEPGCAVLDAVASGAIAAARHAAYIDLQDELDRADRAARGY